jgi:Fe-S-cluster containining protein
MTSSEPFRPRLRDGVTLTPDEDAAAGGMIAVEGVGYRVSLGPNAWSVVRLVDGVRDIDALARDAGGEVDREIATAVVRQLALMNALEGAGDEIVARLRRLRSGAEKPPTLLLDGARFECQGSGECCQNYFFGPLKQSDVERLEALPLAEAFPHVSPPYVVYRESDGKQHPYLAAVDHSCVFLGEDRRCGIHARFGPEAKPDLCRTYPIARVVTYDGIRTSDGGTCARYATSVRRGLPLVDELPSLRPLFYSETDILHPLVELPGVHLDFGHYLKLVRSFLDVARSGRASAPETLRAIGRALAAAVTELRSMAPRGGEPDATVAALAARSWEPFLEATAAPDAIVRGAKTIARIAERLIEMIGVRLASERAAERPYAMGGRLPSELMELLVILQIAARSVVAGAPPADPYFGQILAVRVGDRESDEVLRTSIRQQLFGTRVVVAGKRGIAALLRLAVVQLCAVVGARLEAAAERAERARPEHLSRGHMLAMRVLPVLDSDELLLAEEENAFDALEALPALADFTLD